MAELVLSRCRLCCQVTLSPTPVTAVDGEEVLRQGQLRARPPTGKGESPWLPSHFVLTESRLLQLRSPDASQPPEAVFSLNVNCAVFETTLCPFSFQLVTTGKVLHAAGEAAPPASCRPHTSRELFLTMSDPDGPPLCMLLVDCCRMRQGGPGRVDVGNPRLHLPVQAGPEGPAVQAGVPAAGGGGGVVRGDIDGEEAARSGARAGGRLGTRQGEAEACMLASGGRARAGLIAVRGVWLLVPRA